MYFVLCWRKLQHKNTDVKESIISVYKCKHCYKNICSTEYWIQSYSSQQTDSGENEMERMSPILAPDILQNTQGLEHTQHHTSVDVVQ